MNWNDCLKLEQPAQSPFLILSCFTQHLYGELLFIYFEAAYISHPSLCLIPQQRLLYPLTLSVHLKYEENCSFWNVFLHFTALSTLSKHRLNTYGVLCNRIIVFIIFYLLSWKLFSLVWYFRVLLFLKTSVKIQNTESLVTNVTGLGVIEYQISLLETSGFGYFIIPSEECGSRNSIYLYQKQKVTIKSIDSKTTVNKNTEYNIVFL